ncbi:phosphoglycerate mutase [Ephemerocybe angulata]|uniref:Phosphoglycerate mutase n=1 Tax=Ephemerocybe angulata TaxID=980116 RepID=A0A8H6HE41_9AGAR|nr:phosphoglycerate mutase [Tulosesus angulatus]
MVTITFIRHGQSEDNCRDVWAGWKDAPLSALGKRQAKALGEALSSDTKFTHIYASDLLRAHDTGKAVHARQPEPQPPFTVTELIREQHFGEAEGKKWSTSIPSEKKRTELYNEGVYPVFEHRHEKFPGGESLDDLRARAYKALGKCVFPHLDEDDGHIAIASHGLCISELMAALVRLDPKADQSISYRGLLNTAWTRVKVERREGETREDGHPVLEVIVNHVNEAPHLQGIQEDSVEVPAERSSEAQAFFGGDTTATQASNARVDIQPESDSESKL